MKKWKKLTVAVACSMLLSFMGGGLPERIMPVELIAAEAESAHVHDYKILYFEWVDFNTVYVTALCKVCDEEEWFHPEVTSVVDPDTGFTIYTAKCGFNNDNGICEEKTEEKVVAYDGDFVFIIEDSHAVLYECSRQHEGTVTIRKRLAVCP